MNDIVEIFEVLFSHQPVDAHTHTRNIEIEGNKVKTRRRKRERTNKDEEGKRGKKE